jgi:hypothetical protein
LTLSHYLLIEISNRSTVFLVPLSGVIPTARTRFRSKFKKSISVIKQMAQDFCFRLPPYLEDDDEEEDDDNAAASSSVKGDEDIHRQDHQTSADRRMMTSPAATAFASKMSTSLSMRSASSSLDHLNRGNSHWKGSGSESRAFFVEEHHHHHCPNDILHDPNDDDDDDDDNDDDYRTICWECD